jgi:peptidoglycan/xylan/chitin deacetylase (PgdA/CDA1 family)
MRGVFVVSLDFELHWGLRDRVSVDGYRENLEGVRRAVPALLALFREYDVHATWATVGMLFCETRDELFAAAPERRPRYADRALSPYPTLADEAGASERDDPVHFAPSLIRAIAATPGQEIGTHTFSHYYCLEDGGDEPAFRDDLRAAEQVQARLLGGGPPRSLVFPRNQFRAEYLRACADAGIRAFRGNLPSWLYEGRPEARESWLRRGARLVDAYVPLSGDNSTPLDWARASEPRNVRASRFLRPWSRRLRWLEPLRARRIVRDVERAAAGGRLYHLWWHPHNFGANLDENLQFLRGVLARVRALRASHGLRCLNMGELAAELDAAAAPERAA